MIDYKYKYVNGIFNMSLQSIFQYVVQDEKVENLNIESYQFLRVISDQVCALDEEEVTEEIGNIGDFSFNLDFKELEEGFKILDWHYSIPAMTYILFTWVNVARNEGKYNECKRLWEIIHAITTDPSIFNLPQKPFLKP